MDFVETITQKALELGASRCGVTAVKEVTFDPGLRKNCEMNYCGSYGKNYMCPPDAGEIHQLIQQAQTYDHLLLFQTISPLEDSFDLEGMMEASERHGKLVDGISDYLEALPDSPRYMILGAGGAICASPAARSPGTPAGIRTRPTPLLRPTASMWRSWRSSAACTTSTARTPSPISARCCFSFFL